MSQTDVLVFAAAHNTPNKKDATGAFLPGAQKLCKALGVGQDGVVHRIDNTLPFIHRGRKVCDVLRSKPGRSIVAFFCHGWSTGLQLGFRSSRAWRTKHDEVNWNRLVRYLAEVPSVSIPLYACSTGDGPDGEETPDAPGAGDDSFGDLLRDALCRAGATRCRVVSHTTAGHSFHNPDVILFDGEGRPFGGRGGAVLVPPTSCPERDAFRRLLRRDGKDGIAWKLPSHTLRDLSRMIAEEVGPSLAQAEGGLL